MIEINFNGNQAGLLYEKLKDVILSKTNNSSYIYNKEQHNMYEKELSNEARAQFFNENGSVEFQNSAGNIVVIEINRYHHHSHNGWSGLNSVPCLYAIISIMNQKEKELIWELKVRSGTMYYKAEATSLEIPFHLFEEKIDKKVVEQTKDINKALVEENPEKEEAILQDTKSLKKVICTF